MQLQVLPPMSMPDVDGRSPAASAATTPSALPRQLYQRRPWHEPLAAANVAKKARALMDIKIPKKSWPQYPSRFSTPPANLSFKELCGNYPNHLDGELLVEMSDAGLKPRDIVEMMPSDTRNPNLGTEWSWVTERTKKARLARDNRPATIRVQLGKYERASQPTGHGVLVKVEDASHHTDQGVLVTVEDQSPLKSQAITSPTMPKPIHGTASPAAENQLGPSSSVVSSPTPTFDQVGSETPAKLMMTQAHRPDSSSSFAPTVAPGTHLNWQVSQANKTKSNRPRTAGISSIPATTPTPIDRSSTSRTMIIEGNRFSFQQSPPNKMSASQYATECGYKEALRGEIRKHLKLLIEISSADEAFVSRSQQQQQTDILLQWKKWCDDQSYSLGKRYRVFVDPALTGFVIKDSLTRLLGALTIINMKERGSGRATLEDCARSQAFEYAKALFKQHTSDLQARANQLFQLPSSAATPPPRLIPVAVPPTATDLDVAGDRSGFYVVELSRAALKLTQQSADATVDRTTDEQFWHPA